MSFAQDLWDGFEKVNKRIEDGLALYKDVSAFYKRRSKIEQSYAGELLALVKATAKEKGHYKGGSLTGNFGSVGDAWVCVQEETEKLAKFHLDLSTKLEEQVCQPINSFVRDGEKLRAAHEKEGRARMKALNDAIAAMNKSKSKYHKLSKEAEDAQVASENARRDDNPIKPQVISKLCSKASQQSEKAKQSDSEYQENVQAANTQMLKFYQEEMPKVLVEFQKMEENRIDVIQQTLKKFLLIQEAVPPCIELVCQAISQAVNAVSKKADVQLFIDEAKTGEQRPAAFEYIAYEGKIRESDYDSSSTGGGGGSDEDILNDMEDLTLLSPDQQRERLTAKIETSKAAIKAAIKGRKGLESLVGLYEQQPETKQKVTEELEEAKTRIIALRDKKHELEAWLAELDAGGGGESGPAQASSKQVLFRVRALYPYEAQEGTELSFQDGDVMNVVNEYEGWWDAELKGRVGLIPSTYVERI